MLNLYPHQLEFVSELSKHIVHGPTLGQAPTGFGKTVVATRIALGAYNKGNRVWFICHRRELVRQTVDTFRDAGLPVGIIASGHKYDPSKLVYVCSIDTLRRRVGQITMPDVCIWDEAHHIKSRTWAETMDAIPAHHIGLSATPRRADGAGLGDHFDHIVLGPSVKWLIDNKYLSPYRLYAPYVPDMSSAKFVGGDYTAKTAEEIMDKPTITGCAIGEYKKLADHPQAIVFCTSIQHSIHTAEAFKQAGISAAHLDGKTDERLRDSIIASYRKGEIKVLCNVGLFGEGFDVPNASCLIMLRPTESEGLFLQMCGRVLRYVPGKEAVILDHAGNALRHGMPCEEREWKLEYEKRKRSKGEPAFPVRQCTECYFVHRPALSCPSCGHVYPVQEREINETEGELVEITEIRRQQRIEQGQARTLDQLIALAVQRGYKNPQGWARHVFSARQKKGL